MSINTEDLNLLRNFLATEGGSSQHRAALERIARDLERKDARIKELDGLLGAHEEPLVGTPTVTAPPAPEKAAPLPEKKAGKK